MEFRFEVKFYPEDPPSVRDDVTRQVLAFCVFVFLFFIIVFILHIHLSRDQRLSVVSG